MTKFTYVEVQERVVLTAGAFYGMGVWLLNKLERSDTELHFTLDQCRLLKVEGRCDEGSVHCPCPIKVSLGSHANQALQFKCQRSEQERARSVGS